MKIDLQGIGNRPLPSWLTSRQECLIQFRPFLDTHAFSDDLHGRVILSPLEVDLVNSPEFQRLFRIAQMGVVDYLFASANHTRGVHSIGTCGLAKELILRVNRNTLRSERLHDSPLPQVSLASSVVIAIAALLHDLPHGPFSHDIERRTHLLLNGEGRDERIRSHLGPFWKHDDWQRNPALYQMLLEPKVSVLARVLRAYSPLFFELLGLESRFDSHCDTKPLYSALKNKRVHDCWPDFKHELLPQLVFHCLAGESPRDFDQNGRLLITRDWTATPDHWGLGPGDDSLARSLHSAWYHPYRHDLVGNTLSADLLDYLPRDAMHLGLQFSTDTHFLDHLVLVTERPVHAPAREWTWCALDLTDYKRNAPRIDVIHGIFNILNGRFEVHDKAVFHRITQASIAMLWRSIRLMPTAPTHRSLYNLGQPDTAISGDENFLTNILGTVNTGAPPAAPSHELARKFAERRVYKPLLSIPGDRVAHVIRATIEKRGGAEEPVIREFAALLDSRRYAPFLRDVEWAIERLLSHAITLPQALSEIQTGSEGRYPGRPPVSSRVLFWASPYKQLYKDPSIRITYAVRRRLPDGPPQTLEAFVSAKAEKNPALVDLHRVADAGIRDSDAKYKSAWKASLFLSDGLFYRGILARVNPGLCRSDAHHVEHLQDAQVLAIAALRAIWNHWDSVLAVTRDKYLRDLPDEKTAGRGPLHPLAVDPEPADTEFLRGHCTNPLVVEAARRVVCDPLTPGVDNSHYAHGPVSVTGNLPFADNCRDVRYKFGQPLDHGKLGEELDAVLNKVLGPRADPPLRARAREYLEFVAGECVARNELLTHEEAEEIVVRLTRIDGDARQTLFARTTKVPELFKEIELAPPVESRSGEESDGDPRRAVLLDLWKATW